MPPAELPRLRSRPGTLLYVEVQDTVERAIHDGLFVPGIRLPSTKQLAASLGVGLVTAHRAMQALEARGVVDRVQGRGTFVTAAGSRLKRRFAVVLQPRASLADFYHGSLLDGMNRAARELGVELQIRQASGPVRRCGSSGTATPGGGRPWGDIEAHLLINPLPAAAAAFAETLADGVPSLLVGAHAEGLPHVGVDNADLIRQAVGHLHGLGHRELLFVGAAGELSNSREWREAFGDRCATLGIDGSRRLSADGWRLTAAEKQVLVDLLRRPDAPTAVLCAGYYLSLDLYEVAAAAGLTLPADLSVLGIGDPVSAPHLSPPLTTMHQPLVELGIAAVQRVFGMLGGHAPASVDLRARLVVRASTGRAPRGRASRGGGTSAGGGA